MPSFFIPQCTTVPTPIVASGIVTQGQFVDSHTGALIVLPTSNSPTIMQTWRIVSIRIPVGVLLTAAPPPTAAQVTIAMLISGETVWLTQGNYQLSPVGSGAGANELIDEDLFNPIELYAGQGISFTSEVSFNAAVTGGWDVSLGATFSAAGAPLPQPGVITYTVEYNPRLPGRAPA